MFLWPTRAEEVLPRAARSKCWSPFARSATETHQPWVEADSAKSLLQIVVFLNFFLGIEAEFRVVTFLCGMKKCVVVARGEGGVRGAGTRADKPWQRHERYTRLETSASGDPSHWLYTEEVQRLRWSL